jgi:tetratricopeptide (TPR) repeat protein
VRQYCADRLEQEPAGESADQVQRRHAAYFESLLIAQWGRIFRRKGTIAELAPDMGNLMAAWYWALAADDLKLVWGLGNGLACLADRQGQNLEIAHVLRIGIERLRAAQVAERGGQEERWRDRAIALAMVLANQSERFVRLGRLGDSEACLAEAADWLAEAEAGDAAWAEAHWFHRRMVAWTHYYRDDFVGSLQAWHEVLAELQTGQLALWPYTGDVAAIWLPETYWGRGFNALALGDFPEALRLGEQGLALAEQLGLGLAPGFASHLLAWALLSIGDYERADQVARRFLSIANTYGESLMTAMALSVLGRTQFRLGRYDEARTWWRRGLALARKTGLRGNVVACLVGLGDIELVLGNVAAAQRLYEQCLALVGQPAAAGCPRFAPSPGALPVLIGSGRVALRQGWPTAALERFRQVLSAPSRRVTTTAEALAYVSEALTQEGELEWAAGMCGFLLNWSGTPYHIREVAEKLLGEMTNRLPPKELGDAVRRGEPWRLDEVVARVAGNQ